MEKDPIDYTWANMGKIIQLQTWGSGRRPMLIALDDKGQVWFWDWIDTKWMPLKEVDSDE